MNYQSVTGLRCFEYSYGSVFAKTPEAADVFARQHALYGTPKDAPKWNCVDFPEEGMHYVNRDGDCRWCGKKKADIRRELDKLEKEMFAERESAKPRACKLDECNCHLV